MFLKIIVITILLIDQICLADDDSRRAINHVQKAIFTYPIVKKYAKTAEQEIYEYLPISKQYAGWVGSAAISAVSGKINTRKINRINVKVMGGDMRPDVVYDFRTGETAALVNINWNWE